MATKDIIIGAVTNYNYDDIAPWVNSIKKSGYKGEIGLVAYNMQKDTVDALSKAGVEYLFGFKRDVDGNLSYENKEFNIVLERFVHIWYFLSKVDFEIDNIIATDVKDVVFQTNPSEWLTKQDKQLFVGSENLKYDIEPWNKNNMMLSFGPMIYERMKDNPIYCAGVLAGKRKTMLDFCLNLFLICRGSPAYVSGGGGPDQSAINLLLSMSPYSEVTKFATTNDPFVCHAGTTIAAIKSGSGAIGISYLQDPSVLDKYQKNLIDGEPKLVNDTVCTPDGIPYCIVHQYDRVNEWKSIIQQKYAT